MLLKIKRVQTLLKPSPSSYIISGKRAFGT
jgi:propionyl-CoA synthetase